MTIPWTKFPVIGAILRAREQDKLNRLWVNHETERRALEQRLKRDSETILRYPLHQMSRETVRELL